MKGALIIGYGNPLRQDDGVGWHAAQHLKSLLTESPVQVLTCHQLTPELAEPISRAERVAFIDASLGEPAGQILDRAVNPDPSPDFDTAHRMEPTTLMGYARDLYRSCPPATIFSIGVQSIDLGEALSPTVASALPHLLARIQEWLQQPERERPKNA